MGLGLGMGVAGGTLARKGTKMRWGFRFIRIPSLLPQNSRPPNILLAQYSLRAPYEMMASSGFLLREGYPACLFSFLFPRLSFFFFFISYC